MISRTFYVLFVIDYVGFEALGVLLAISIFVQAVFDYPSGTIGDWIGQKWILTVSFFCYSLSYGLLIYANSFTDILLVYLISAFASSQESGALQSWFENNYKISSNNSDSNREVFKELQGKIHSILGFLGACMFIVGGFLATIFFRKIVFLIQSLGMLILAILCLIFVKDFPEIIKPKKNYSELFQNFK